MKQNFHIDNDRDRQVLDNSRQSAASGPAPKVAVSLLTAGRDRPYVFGLAGSLTGKGVALDLIGSDELDSPDFRDQPGTAFLNLRGDLRPNARFLNKIFRITRYYAKLIWYAATAKPRLFHILWNNKFELIDRTLLMLYYRLLKKKIVLTVHNVNASKRDCKDTLLNRFTLRVQYRLAHHLFVHTENMKLELVKEFDVQRSRVTVIPFGINNAVPNTSLTPPDAKRRLGLDENEKTILFFGRITPYKGLEYLIAAFRQILTHDQNYRLVIAGTPDDNDKYWKELREDIRKEVQTGRILLRDNFIPDSETEVYFKAADVLVLPYRHIYQSGVLFLGHSFGLPVLAADVGSFRDEIVEGGTGFVFQPEDPAALKEAIERYFASDLYLGLDSRRQEIKDYTTKWHSWDVVSQMTIDVYAGLLRIPSSTRPLTRDAASALVDMNVQP